MKKPKIIKEYFSKGVRMYVCRVKGKIKQFYAANFDKWNLKH